MGTEIQGNLGAGIGVGGAGRFYLQVSSATNLNQLNGPFIYDEETVAVGDDGEYASLFWNSSGTVWGADIGYAIGYSASASFGVSGTRVTIVAGPGTDTNIWSDIGHGIFGVGKLWVAPKHYNKQLVYEALSEAKKYKKRFEKNHVKVGKRRPKNQKIYKDYTESRWPPMPFVGAGGNLLAG